MIDIAPLTRSCKRSCKYQRNEVNEMSICDNCIHNNVCGEEGHLDEALTYCADKLKDTDIHNNQNYENGFKVGKGAENEI